ncbi:MAG: hypothetical protein Q4G25_00880 [Paracoccus sp. (in: a-proteobacteria)]|nr:hypothetical protein [Paracoccus sp. (in: a-proteobacteria)]
MDRHYTEDEILARIETLTRPRLTAWVHARIVRPVQSQTGDLYREVDLARLALLCDLDEDFRLDDDAMRLVMSLLDQVHALRGQMSALMGAVAAEPDEVRLRLRGVIARDWSHD